MDTPKLSYSKSISLLIIFGLFAYLFILLYRKYTSFLILTTMYIINNYNFYIILPLFVISFFVLSIVMSYSSSREFGARYTTTKEEANRINLKIKKYIIYILSAMLLFHLIYIYIYMFEILPAR